MSDKVIKKIKVGDEYYQVGDSIARSAITEIESKIPPQALPSNQLADKNFVNSSINSVTAYYITKNSQGDQFVTKAELDAATTFYSGGEVRVPTRNDYCIVQADETKQDATTRYIYQNNQWEFQYVVNETALTADQIAALNSGITSTAVSKLNGIEAGAQVNTVTGAKLGGANGTQASIDSSGNIIIPKASSSVAGVFSPLTVYATEVLANNGALTCNTKTLAQYGSFPNGGFIGKGTLENVKTDIVKRAITDTTQTAYTTTEKTNACSVIGAMSSINPSGTGYFALNQTSGTLGSYSFTEGSSCIALGKGAHAEGYLTVASGVYSHSEGQENLAKGSSAHAEGTFTSATGEVSHTEGNSTIAAHDCTHAEGNLTQALGAHSHSEGAETIANAEDSHSEGCRTYANGYASHAEGYGYRTYSATTTYLKGEKVKYNNVYYKSISDDNTGHTPSSSATYWTAITQQDVSANGVSAHVEGYCNGANGNGAHAEGYGNSATGVGAHVEGQVNIASGNGAHAEGHNTQALQYYSHAEGNFTLANGGSSHAEGMSTTATGGNSHAEGYGTESSGAASHAEGSETSSSGAASHAEGSGTNSDGQHSHAEGMNTTASGTQAHAEGNNSQATGNVSHAEGSGTSAIGNYSHSEGLTTTASGAQSHAEGYNTLASGQNTHAEGNGSQAIANNSHAEGKSIANHYYAHTEGYNTASATGVLAQHVQGQYNVITSGAADVVGWGTGENARKNISTLMTNGDLHIKGDVYVGANDNGTGGTKLGSGGGNEPVYVAYGTDEGGSEGLYNTLVGYWNSHKTVYTTTSVSYNGKTYKLTGTMSGINDNCVTFTACIHDSTTDYEGRYKNWYGRYDIIYCYQQDVGGWYWGFNGPINSRGNLEQTLTGAYGRTVSITAQPNKEYYLNDYPATINITLPDASSQQLSNGDEIYVGIYPDDNCSINVSGLFSGTITQPGIYCYTELHFKYVSTGIDGGFWVLKESISDSY